MKRIITLLVTVTLLATNVLPSFAASKKCECGLNPVIIVNGMGYAPFVADAGTKNEHNVFPPSDNAVLAELITEGIVAIRQGALLGNRHRFESKVMPAIYDYLKEFRCAPDGTSVYDITTTTYPDSIENYPEALGGNSHEGGLMTSAAEKLPARHAYDYNYDWRMSPLQNAKDLRAMVEYAKENSGHDKVDIICCSMGGIQTMGYIYKYGTEDIDSIIFESSTFDGVYLVGDILTKAIDINLDDVAAFLGQQFNANDTIAPLYKVLSAIGAAGFTQKTVDSLMKDELDVVYEKLLIPLFGYMGGVWALCQDDKYEEAKKIMLADAAPKFIEMIDEFHYNVLNKTSEIISESQKNGTKYYVFSHYDYYAVPLYERDKVNADGLLETACTGGNATVALHGETLGENYKQKNTVCKNASHNHVSPDNIIDASTCILPESTWFIKNLYHVNVVRNTEYDRLLWELVFSDEQLTVNSFKEFPQFLMADTAGETYPIYALHDLDGDGKVTTVDARLCLMGAAEISELKTNQLFAATWDDTAATVSTDDAKNILTDALGLK